MKSGPLVPESEILEVWKSRTEENATSFFQTADWASLLVRHFREYRLEPVVTDTLFVPLIRHRRYGGLTDSLYGMPMMTRGGFIDSNPDSPADWEGALEALPKSGVGTIVISLPPSFKARKPSSGFHLDRGSTHLLSLGSSWEAALKGFERRGRNAYRRAVKEGIVVVRGESEEGVRRHWELVEPSFRRWKPKPAMTYAFIKDCVRCRFGRLYLALQGEKAVASLVAFAFRKELVLWQSSRVSEEYPRGTENLLYGRVIEDGIREGFETVDFGASLGDPGIVLFKESFGARAVEYGVLKYAHPLVRFAKRWVSATASVRRGNQNRLKL